ncbi:hypothetical protein RhiirA1_480587 [Rhizophagus irregularis]|uniref:C2H2-type domain-containing protein n=1 Tax=Rhizophagus irregularis TaxID=588596 RepID=A0A2N0QP42_9GLOM|nr:hypothetical protein RhiirA1_480587 [Rhizophagus irregularis]
MPDLIFASPFVQRTSGPWTKEAINSKIYKNKKNHICECCGKTLATPQKLRQHYSSTKNQCSLPSENNINQRRVNTPKVTRPIRPKSPRPCSPSPVPVPVVHTKGKD